MSFDNVEDAFALSPMQAGMLFDNLSAPDNDIYATHVTIDVVGNVDAGRFQRAWNSVFNMHQALRAEFHWEELDQPLQVIAGNVELPWVTLDWSQNSTEQHDALMRQLIANSRADSINISRAPLSRFTLIKLSETHWRVVWRVHHLLADGMSTPIILSDVLDCYLSDQKREQTDNSVYQYSQYIQWLGNQNQELAEKYWQSALATATPTPTNLRAALLPGAATAVEEVPEVKFGLTKSQTERLTDYCRNHHLTVSTFLHAAWALLLRCYTGRDASLFLSTVSGRQSETSGMEKAVGLFLNALPRWIPTTGSKPLIGWMQDIQTNILESAKYDYFQLRHIQAYIDKGDAEDTFESIVTIGAHPGELDISSPNNDIRITNVHHQTIQSHYPLAFLAFPGEALEMSLVFNSERYHHSDIKSMADHLGRVIHCMVSDERQSLDTLVGLFNKELASKRVEQRPVAGAGMNTVHQWFESVSDKHPEKTCVVYESKMATYAEIDAKANQIARMILQSVDSENVTLIGLMLPRCVEQIVGLLGVLKSGLAYVPIDPDYPQSTIQTLLNSAGIEYILTDTAFSSEEISSSVSCLFVSDALHLPESRVQEVQCEPDSLAYVMYTSGSTGKPKGVKISHANLLYSTATRIDYYQKPPDKFLLLSSIAFDSSVAGIYWSLCSGGALVLPRTGQEKDILEITEIIRTHKITHTLCLPSYYQLLLQYAEPHMLGTLEVVIVAGESCTRELVKQHFDQRTKAYLNGALLYNEYGPTEACVWSSVYRFDSVPDNHIPIGKPVGTTCLQVVNVAGNPCPTGTEGEIVIGGPGVSPGYLGDVMQTEEKFKSNNVAAFESSVLYHTGDLGYVNENGDLVYSGRLDRQLKIRGYRIEPGDIESVLNEHPAIEKSVVVAIDQNRTAAEEYVSSDREQMLKKIRHEFSEESVRRAIVESGIASADPDSIKIGVA